MADRAKSPAPNKNARRTRNPDGTRELILEAARQVLAQDGKEGLSVSQVARRAGVNRGTAYQHFQTREQLIEATAEWVSDKLFHAVYGKLAPVVGQTVDSLAIKRVTEHLADFAMENPELGRAWLFELLSSRRPASDRFWRAYESSFEDLARSEHAQPGIDTEVVSVLTLAGMFLWPVWARAHARNAKERQQMAKRLSREVLRLSMHGTLRPERFPELDARSDTKRKVRGRR
ncbi:MAG TPA: TetR/AcrR family transcriptional regulator [Steroidobacteraceae bacterium]|nr:TetR/AcrR family transcriptional regulator [Steroidobacteraceae bacterium]